MATKKEANNIKPCQFRYRAEGDLSFRHGSKQSKFIQEYELDPLTGKLRKTELTDIDALVASDLDSSFERVLERFGFVPELSDMKEVSSITDEILDVDLENEPIIAMQNALAEASNIRRSFDSPNLTLDEAFAKLSAYAGQLKDTLKGVRLNEEKTEQESE